MWDFDDARRVSLAWYLIAAALFHAVVWQATQSGLITFPKGDRTHFAKQAPAPVEVERFTETTDRNGLPIVQTDRAQFDKKLLKQKARFGGEFDNRVEQETRAAMSGKFQAGPSQMAQRRRLAEAMDKSRDREQTRMGDDGDIPAEQKRERPSPGTPGALGMADLMAYGASPNKFPSDISAGPNTMLNTDKVMYASYINRIADEIYEPWVTFAQEAAVTLRGLGKNVEENTYVTKLGITLDDKGVVLGIQTLKSSGVELFDESAKKAFWETDPFPNPPSQLFDAQKRVRLTYEFHFEWKSSFYGIFPRRI